MSFKLFSRPPRVQFCDSLQLEEIELGYLPKEWEDCLDGSGEGGDALG